jgi:hypothetical protein
MPAIDLPLAVHCEALPEQRGSRRIAQAIELEFFNATGFAALSELPGNPSK